jgi:hypothetical protein
MQMKTRSLLWLLFGLLFFAVVFLVRIQEDMVDFEVNYRAGQRMRMGENLYQTSDGHFMFKYAPFSALLYVPLSYLSLDVAKPVWYSITVACTIFLFTVSYRLARRTAPNTLAFAVFPPLILAKFFFREMKLGQINTIVASVMLFMIWHMREEAKLDRVRETLVGGLWGLGTALKPYGLIFFPYFFVKGMWRALVAGVGILGFTLVTPAVFYGIRGNIDIHREWVSTLSHSTPSLFTTADNVSIVAFMMKWTGSRHLSSWAYGLLVTGLALLLLGVIRKGRTLPRRAVLECSILLTLIPLVSPLGWDYTFLLSVLGVTLLVAHFSQFSTGWRWFLAANFCVIGLAIYDIIGRTYYQTFMMWSVLTISFLILVGYLASLRFKNVL